MKFAKFVVEAMRATKTFAIGCIGIAICLFLLETYILGASLLGILSLAVAIVSHITQKVYARDIEEIDYECEKHL